MGSYRCPEIARLAHELTLSPVRLRLRQLAGVRWLIHQADAARDYPYAFVCFHITGFRPRRMDDTVLNGKALAGDLAQLMDEITAAHPLPPEAARGRLWDAEALARRFKVSTKTISRWRTRGLPGCWYALSDRPRLAFDARDVESFVARHAELIRRGTSFQIMSAAEKLGIIARAREIVATEKCSMHTVSVRLAEETGRAVETIRYTLRRYDVEHPGEALFDRTEQARPLDDRQVIYEAWSAGDSVKALAVRFNRREGEIRRIVTRAKAEQVLASPIACVYHASFDAPDAEARLLADDEASRSAARTAGKTDDPLLVRTPEGLPPYLAALYQTPLLAPEEESRLFEQMNLLLHRAEVRRGRLPQDPDAVSAAALAEIDDLLHRARNLKNRLIQANLRLVVSIARRHLRGGAESRFFELISDGNLALMRAVEKFDFARGFRFSTYATWAIKRGFARSIPEEIGRAARFQTGHEELLNGSRDPRTSSEYADLAAAERLRQALAGSLGLLDDRERTVVERHYGLSGAGGETLDEIGRELGICKERTRQIEIRALGKLRDALGAGGAELLAG